MSDDVWLWVARAREPLHPKAVEMMNRAQFQTEMELKRKKEDKGGGGGKSVCL